VNKAQALALMNALEGQKVNADAQLRFDNAGVESWLVAIEPTSPLTGAQLAALAAYCANNNLALTATFSQLGIT